MSLVSLAREIADALDQGYLDRAIREVDVIQFDDTAYADTHLALLYVLLGRLGGKILEDFAAADRRLAVWEPLGVQEPFNAFALALSLLLVRDTGVDHALRDRLERLNRRQTLQAAETHASRSGNNIYVMHVVTERLLRPLALCQPLDLPGAAADLDRLFAGFEIADGIYSDWPRDQSALRIAPPTYALKFAYLIAVAWIFTADPRLGSRFARAARTLAGTFTDDGAVALYGRSENSVFAQGLGIFVVRFLRAMTPSAAMDRQLAAQEGRLRSMSRTSGGWLEVNDAFPGGNRASDRIVARDGYAMPTEYSTACLCYALLAEHLTSLNSSWRRVPVAEIDSSAAGDALGLVRLARGDSEIVVRTKGDLVEGNRRYCGPTLLRVRVGGRLLVGTIPIVRRGEEGRVSAVCVAWDLLRHGRVEMRFLSVGFIPVLSTLRRRLVAQRLVSLSVTDSGLEAKYEFCSLPLGRISAFTAFSRDLCRKNLGLPDAHIRPRLFARGRPIPGIALHRRIKLLGSGCEVEDRVEGAPPGSRLQIAGRHLEGAEIDVEGLRLREKTAGWSSDGWAVLPLWEERIDGGGISYRLVIRPRHAPGAGPGRGDPRFPPACEGSARR